MLNWLDSVWNAFTGGLSSIWHSIVNLFKSIWSWIERAVGILEHDIAIVYHDILSFAHSVEVWATRAIDNLYNLAKSWVNDVTRWAVAWFDRIIKYADDIWSHVVQIYNEVIHYIDGLYNSIVHWIITEIWDPLDRAITGAINWIEREGAYVYDLLTHPDKLVTLIEAYLWKSWLSWMRALAIPITVLILSSFRSLIPDLMSIAEDVLDRVL